MTANPVVVTNNDRSRLVRKEFTYIYDVCSGILKKEEENGFDNISSKMNALYKDVITEKDINVDEILLLAESYLLLSYKYLNESNKDIALAKFGITKALKLIEGRELDSKFILIAIEAYQYSYFFYTKQKDKELANSVCVKALELYFAYTKKEIYPAPYSLKAYLQDDSIDTKDILEERSAVNMKMILDWCMTAGIYISTKEINIDSILLGLHKILEKKLNNLTSSTQYDIWIDIIGSLCKYFIKNYCFTEARDHLAAISFILKKFKQNTCTNIEQKEVWNNNEIHEKYLLNSMYVAIYWGEYGIQLLRSSQEKILFDREHKCTLCNLNRSLVKSNGLLTFVDIKKDLQEFITITDRYVSSFSEAHAIFETVMKLLNKAKRMNKLDKHNITYMHVILSMSHLNKYFEFYINKVNKWKLYEQRMSNLTLLTTTLETLNQKNINTLHWLIYFEAIIAINNALDKVRDNFRIHSNELATESSIKLLKEMESMEIKKILKKCKILKDFYKNLFNGKLTF